MRRPGVRSIVLLVAIAGVLGCSNDFEDLPMNLGRGDHGWLVTIEPDEPLEVGLLGNALHPEARWRIADLDESVVEIDRQEYEGVSWDVEDFTGDDRATVTISLLRGAALGETPLTFELHSGDGDHLATTEFVVRVVDDACAADTGLVANRCGRSAAEHHQGLTEVEHGWLVALEPDETIDVVLTGNPQYSEGVWQLDDVDSTAITIGDPARRVADRTPGDWDPSSDAVFLPTWTFTVAAAELGRARTEFSFRSDDRVIDVYSVTFDVVADACETDSNQSSCHR